MRMLARWPTGLRTNPSSDRPRALPREHHYTANLDEHMGLIGKQVYKSLRDPELRQLTVRLVSDSFDYAPHPATGRMVPLVPGYGQWFLAPEAKTPCPPRDESCEIQRIWDFVHINMRYVYDPDEVDFFATARASLEAGGGDCDDFTILIAAMGGLIGFKRAARVVSVREAPDDFVHVYPMLGINSKDSPSAWVPLDDTVQGSYPGWQYPNIAKYVDYEL